MRQHASNEKSERDGRQNPYLVVHAFLQPFHLSSCTRALNGIHSLDKGWISTLTLTLALISTLSDARISHGRSISICTPGAEELGARDNKQSLSQTWDTFSQVTQGSPSKNPLTRGQTGGQLFTNTGTPKKGGQWHKPTQKHTKLSSIPSGWDLSPAITFAPSRTCFLHNSSGQFSYRVNLHRGNLLAELNILHPVPYYE